MYYYNMEIRENDKICIFTPLASMLDKNESKRLFELLNSETRKIAIDLCNVNDCSIDFIFDLKDFLSGKKLGIFNIQSDIFVLFNTMNIDKIAELFVSEIDFISEKRQLLKRNFKLVY